ncbi:YheC/YheD family protein [Paenibacillus sp. MBLB4367]|uniref:YheC/YheD family endospore coat-associated protein n=1 Tax=Paenibacillus sp. MBLB4367 TaxID=3384767 RepID=UPI003907EB89
MHIEWNPTLNPDQILLSTRWIDHLGEVSQPITVHFGAWQKKANVRFDEQIQDHTIVLPERLMKEFTLPDAIPFEFYMEGSHMYIGPVIAFMVSKQKLTERLMHYYRRYFANNQGIKGLVYICSVKGINPVHKTVQGYYYNQDLAKEGKNPWKKGIFPYPSAVYRRVGLRKNRLYDDLANHISHKVFNSVYVNKWDFRTILSSDPLVREHLPHTISLTNLQSLDNMLDLHGSVYLKPVNGSFGKGIRRVDKTKRGYLFIYRKGTKSFITKKMSVKKRIGRMKATYPYIIQQSVAFTRHNKNIDFRVIMQKDASEKWECSGIVARFGREGRVYTNDISSIQLASHTLRDTFQLDDDQARKKEQEMISICRQACLVLEKYYGIYGDLGIDVVVDPHLKVWLLEMNSRQQPEIAVLNEDPHMYYRVIARPFEYARSLAGFTQEKVALYE